MMEISGKIHIGVQSNPQYCEDKWAFNTVDSYIICNFSDVFSFVPDCNCKITRPSWYHLYTI